MLVVVNFQGSSWTGNIQVDLNIMPRRSMTDAKVNWCPGVSRGPCGTSSQATTFPHVQMFHLEISGSTSAHECHMGSILYIDRLCICMLLWAHAYVCLGPVHEVFQRLFNVLYKDQTFEQHVDTDLNASEGAGKDISILPCSKVDSREPTCSESAIS